VWALAAIKHKAAKVIAKVNPLKGKKIGVKMYYIANTSAVSKSIDSLQVQELSNDLNWNKFNMPYKLNKRRNTPRNRSIHKKTKLIKGK